jgi:6-pyruvoyltetrahydropterin/6-carboxytetrahydropterin synthase
MDVTAKLTYAIGHRLLGYQGLCSNLHGHNYDFEITAEGNPNEIGLVIDFKELKAAAKTLLDRFDHAMVLVRTDPAADYIKLVGDRLVLLSVNPSAENLSSLLFNHLQDRQIKVKSVKVRESDGGWATTDRVDRQVNIIGYFGS